MIDGWEGGGEAVGREKRRTKNEGRRTKEEKTKSGSLYDGTIV